MLKFFLLVCFTVSAFVDSFPLDESEIEGRILGGNNTDISQVPYLVALYDRGFHRCGGFIVSPTHIVTAADCLLLIPINEFMIRAGSTSIIKGGVTATAKKFHLHPNFTHVWERDYDVAVIELNAPLKLNDKTMKAIKLATKEPSTGSVALVSGWGTNDEEGSAEMLRSVSLPIYDRTKCATDYKPFNETITPRMLCAYAHEKRIDCRDTGSPLVYKGEVVGVASMRYPETDEIMASVFTSIAHPEIAKFIKDVAKL